MQIFKHLTHKRKLRLSRRYRIENPRKARRSKRKIHLLLSSTVETLLSFVKRKKRTTNFLNSSIDLKWSCDCVACVIRVNIKHNSYSYVYAYACEINEPLFSKSKKTIEPFFTHRVRVLNLIFYTWKIFFHRCADKSNRNVYITVIWFRKGEKFRKMRLIRRTFRIIF